MATEGETYEGIRASGPTVYLAARYTRREELCAYRSDVLAAGGAVTSRWLNGAHQLLDAELMTNDDHDEKRREFALDDWVDLMAADVCVSFTEPPRSNHSRGGRHVEFGAAYARGLRCIVVGYRENVFHCLPDVEFYETWPEALRALLSAVPGTEHEHTEARA